MGLQFFADHCVSNAIMHTLREAGHSVVRLQEHLPVESPDADVIAKAQQLETLFSCHSQKTFLWNPSEGSN